MRGPWKSRLLLSLSLVAASARAGEVIRNPVRPRPAAAVLERPVVLKDKNRYEPQKRIVLDREIEPVGYAGPPPAAVSVTAASQGPEVARPMPNGPAAVVEASANPLVSPTAEPPLIADVQPPDPPMPPVGAPLGLGQSSPPSIHAGNEFTGSPPGGGFWDHRVYGSAEYLLWLIRDSVTPPLVTTSSDSNDLGILGRPTTSVLFGGVVDNEPRSGGRFTLGVWCDDARQLGIEGQFLFLGQRSLHFFNGSTGATVLARPITNALAPDAEMSLLTAHPSPAFGQAGTDDVLLMSSLLGAEINLRKHALDGGWCRLDVLGGFRYVQLDESLTIQETETPFVATNFVQSIITDGFQTNNQFRGAQVGAIAEFRWRRWLLDLRGKLALGGTHEVVEIQGNGLFVLPTGSTQVNPSNGILAQPSNSGRFTRDTFSFIPEIGVNLNYQFTDQLRGLLGYTLLYWNNVARPGNQVSRNLNLNQLGPTPTQGGPPQPAFLFNGTDFWAQGLNLGLEYVY